MRKPECWNLRLRARQTVKNGTPSLDFFIVDARNVEMYAFTRRYSRSVKKLLRREVRVEELIRIKSKDYDIMKFVGHVNRMIPFLIEYYDLRRIA